MVILKKVLKVSLVYVLSFLALFCVLISFIFSFSAKIKSSSGNFTTVALKLSLPTFSKISRNKNLEEVNPEKHSIYAKSYSLKVKPKEEKSVEIKENIDYIDKILRTVPVYEFKHQENEETFSIKECLFGTSGTKCSNFFVNNQTKLNINFLEKLNENLDFKIQKNNDPQVLVMHTHTSESYMDKDRGFYYQNTEFHSTNNSRNVTLVGDAICKVLEKNEIKTIHDITYHDVPMYTGSYKRSEKTIKRLLEKNPSLKVVLDIHRDTIEYKDRKKIKPTVKIDGRKAAQVMIISGCDTDGSLEHPNWEENLKFSLKLQREIETLYPGLVRALLFTHARYNQHLTKGSTLIEIGTDANTLEEAVYSGILVGESLSRLLNRL